MKTIHSILNISYYRKALINFSIILSLSLGTTGCDNFLNIVPDNIANLDHAFANKKEAERFVATLYSQLPQVGFVSNIHLFGADDAWTYRENNYSYQSAWKIALGEQNTSNPYINAWEGVNHINCLWEAIRNCNIFIEEMNKPERVPELDDRTRKRWIAEAKCLKGFYHFFLFRMYGPIPITDVNIPVQSPTEMVRVKRDPVDDVVKYIADLMKEASEDLPEQIDKMQTEAGRLTKGAALALRAKVLTTGASALFNGNPDFADFVDKDGKHLFNKEFSKQKWQDAATACEEALEALNDLSLHTFTESVPISERTRIQLSQTSAFWDRYNNEIIWGRYISEKESQDMQTALMVPHIDPNIEKSTYWGSYSSVTLNMAERYYTKNGVPIEEDKEWHYNERYQLTVTDESQKHNLQENFETVKFNIDRENRYYGNLAFDGSLFYLESCPGKSDDNAFVVRAKFGQPNGAERAQYSTVSGIWMKKLIHWTFTQTDQGSITDYYTWPELRLADLYLLTAECYNEIGKGDLAIYYLDLIRERAGLKGVEESWTKYSNNPNKFRNIEGLREIIHQEREIELAFEGERIWDLRRWKKAGDFQNKNAIGWNVKGKNAKEYYQPTILDEQIFVTPRDYLWPISINELRRNPNLVQNPGWN